MEAAEAAKTIEEENALCAKAAKQVSQTWEALIDDVELEKVAEQLHTAETKANQMKNEMKKPPFVVFLGWVSTLNIVSMCI